MRCSEWARRHFRLSPESSAIEGAFEPWPFQTAILDCMGNDAIRGVSWRKSARIGYSKCLTAATGYFHHHKRRNVVIYQPTDSDAVEFVKDYIDPMIRDCQVVGDLLAASSRNTKENTLRTKYFLGSTLHIRGGTSANNYRRLTKDVLIFDELDGFELNIEGEGDPVSLAQKRIRDSSFPKEIMGTTPTIDGRSLIQKRESEANLVFHYNVACIHCGELQPYEWGGREATYGFKWDAGQPDSVRYLCRHCTGEWRYSDAWKLQEGGRWQTEDGHYIDSESDLRNAEGELVPWPRSVAFITWAALSLLFPWPEMVYEFLDAGTDPAKLQTFTNTTRAEYWRDETVSVEAEPLLERRESYDYVPEAVRVVTIGADLQGDRLEYEIVGWGAGEECWSLDYRVIRGDPTRDQLWTQFLAELKEPLRTLEGRVLRPLMVCLDCGYLSEEVYAFSRRAGTRFVVPCRGLSVAGRPIAVMPRRPSKDGGVYICQCGTDNAKETVYHRLQIEEPGPGYCHFPQRDVYDEEYFRQLTGEEKRPIVRRGRRVLAFQQAHSSVEALDCRVYALVALKAAMQVYRNVNLDEVLVEVKMPSLEELANQLNG